jgi:hypothetical protein
MEVISIIEINSLYIIQNAHPVYFIYKTIDSLFSFSLSAILPFRALYFSPRRGCPVVLTPFFFTTIFFLQPHAKFQNPRTTHSGKKESERRREREKTTLNPTLSSVQCIQTVWSNLRNYNAKQPS